MPVKTETPTLPGEAVKQAPSAEPIKHAPIQHEPIQHGPAEPPVKHAPPTRPAPPKRIAVKLAFSLDSFKITNTRSRHEDTDYVSFTLLHQPHAGSPVTQTLKKSLGDKNNGTFPIGLSFPSVVVSPGDTIVMNYVMINSGHKNESQVFSTLEDTGSKLATAGLTAAGAAIGTAIPIPGVGTLLGAAAGWLTGEVKDLLDANCDGTVAAEQVKFTYDDLVAKTEHGPIKEDTYHPGTDSAHGCGSNSKYYVAWHIQRA